MKYSIRIDPKLLASATQEALAAGAEAGLKRVGLRAEKEARSRAPIDTGSLKSSISSQAFGAGLKMKVVVGPNAKSNGAPYDLFQELGTGLYAETWDGAPVAGRHRIRPKSGKVLAFRARGEGYGKVVTSAGWKSKGAKSSIYTKSGKLKKRASSTTKTTKFHGDKIAVQSVAGSPAVHYMKRGVEATPVSEEFAKGFNSSNHVATR